MASGPVEEEDRHNCACRCRSIAFKHSACAARACGWAGEEVGVGEQVLRGAPTALRMRASIAWGWAVRGVRVNYRCESEIQV